MRCSVHNCPSKTNSERNMFFTFPKDTKLQNKWLKFCNSNGTINVKLARVCPKHFKPEQFARNKKGKIAGLKPNVVPSVEFPEKTLMPLQQIEQSSMYGDMFGTVAMCLEKAVNAPNNFMSQFNCNMHNDIFQYVCENCKVLLCQFCIRQGHVNHTCIHVNNFVPNAWNILLVLIESGHIGAKCLENSINKELEHTRFIDTNCDDLKKNIRSSFRTVIAAMKEREQFLLESVEELRKKRMQNLYEQMTALKSTYFSLMEATNMLQQLAEKGYQMDNINIAMKIVKGNGQIDESAKVFRENEPRRNLYKFYEPHWFLNILRDIARQGSVELEESHVVKNEYVAASMEVITNLLQDSGDREMVLSVLNKTLKQGNRQGIDVEIPTGLRKTTYAPVGKAIPGWIENVKAFRSDVPTLAFATKGNGDGQVSRPWRVCVTKLGQILVTDRRNNNVQVFNGEGRFLFKFGKKGCEVGKFDAPAGICVDKSGRIIVADKNNHRVQVFRSSGKYLLSFGELGSENGKLKFPFDVAVNENLQIAVSDSAHHRIQQFEHNGRFIRHIQLGTYDPTGDQITPRGICYTPTGKIIVTDYTNHCLHLIDPVENKILSSKGSHGTENLQFVCPSGVCCDDEGSIIVADSHNHRVVVFNVNLECSWIIDVRPSVNRLDMAYFNESDRTCDVALTRDGRIVFVTELLPANEDNATAKRFVHVY